MRSYLIGEGVEVRTAARGDEALDEVFRLLPDIVVLDVAMPGTTGLDILARIRQARLDTAVIITTAYGSEEVVADALRRGADDYIRKPFEKVDFLAVLDRTTARQLLHRQNASLRIRLEEQRRQLEREVAHAADTLAGMLPVGSPCIEGFDVAAVCTYASEAGGDFYDWQQLPSGALSLTVGDVMGKGLGAALLMATARAVMRAVVADDSPPSRALQRASAALDEDLGRIGAFITLFHGRLDPKTGVLRYVDAGHGYAVIRRADGRTEELTRVALPLGVDTSERYLESIVHIEPGDTLIIYSDGLAEARPDLFSFREGVARAAAGEGSASEVIQTMLREVADVKPLPDDLTLVVVKRSDVRRD